MEDPLPLLLYTGVETPSQDVWHEINPGPGGILGRVDGRRVEPRPGGGQGIIKGSIVGGIVGHYAGHHGLLGAAAGCAVGHHMAKKHATEHAQPSSDVSGSPHSYGNTVPSESANPPR